MTSRAHVLVANAGTLHSFRTATGLRRHGLLKRCVTSLYFRDQHFRMLPPALRKDALQWTANRRCGDLDGVVTTNAWRELVCLAARRLRIGSETEWLEWRNRRFCAWAARHCLNDVRLVWALDTSSYEIFVKAKPRGILCVLDMSIAHPALGHRLMNEYAQRRPELASSLDLSASDEAMERRRAEIELADHIVVGSSFVRDSLLEQGVSPSKITVNPYGVDIEHFRPRRDTPRTALRFLFVGWFSARKGIYDLLDAWALSGLGEAGHELVLAGGERKDLTCWAGAIPAGIQFAGRVGHAEVPKLYESADVFVFPSLFEGSARVILEAMASGLPVITTPAACDEHWVVDRQTGFRVAAGDAAALASRMRELAEQPALRAELGARGFALVQRYTWATYGDRCAATCRGLLGLPQC